MKKNAKIIVEDSNACTAEWVNYSLLELYLRAEIKVVMIASQQSYFHYNTVLKKMGGINLQTSIDNDKLVFIDCFSEPFSFNQF